MKITIESLADRNRSRTFTIIYTRKEGKFHGRVRVPLKVATPQDAVGRTGTLSFIHSCVIMRYFENAVAEVCW